MIRFVTQFLLIIMLMNVAAPMVLRLQGEYMGELTELSSDDADEKSKTETETETEKEKESYSEKLHALHNLSLTDGISRQRASYFNIACLISQHHSRMLEMPPEA